MKVICYFILFLSLTSCSMVRYTQKDFTGKKYEWYASTMIGKSMIKFISDSSFVYSERDSLFVCTGHWQLVNDKKTILLESADNTNKFGSNTPIAIMTNNEFKIISKNSIKDKDNKLYKIKR